MKKYRAILIFIFGLSPLWGQGPKTISHVVNYGFEGTWSGWYRTNKAKLTKATLEIKGDRAWIADGKGKAEARYLSIFPRTINFEIRDLVSSCAGFIDFKGERKGNRLYFSLEGQNCYGTHLGLAIFKKEPKP